MIVQLEGKKMAKLDKYITLAAAGCAAAGAAQAGEDSFLGFYAGGGLGTLNSSSGSGYNYSLFNVGVNYFGGYNWATGNGLVLGVEAGGWVTPHNTNQSYYGIQNLIEAKFRVGKAFGDTLIYGSVGVWSSDYTWSSSYSARGVSVGAGIEKNLTDSFFVGADISHHLADGSAYKMETGITSASLRAGFRW